MRLALRGESSTLRAAEVSRPALAAAAAAVPAVAACLARTAPLPLATLFLHHQEHPG